MTLLSVVNRNKMAMSTSLVAYDNKVKKTLPPDSLNEIVPPLDYSFLSITAMEELYHEEPRITSPRKKAPISSKKGEEEVGEKSRSSAFRINNNELKDINNIMPVISSIFFNPQNIKWIDLSFNSIAKIDPVLSEFENLQILYLHRNAITELKEVNKLASIKKLTKLTLHGNPIEEIKGYRLHCMSAVAGLLNFDFATITKCDRRTATTWKSMNRPKPMKKED